MKKENIKPLPFNCYDYMDCQKYLETKYNFKERDLLGHWDLLKKLRDSAKKKVSEKYGDSWYSKRPLDYTEEEKKAYEEYNELTNKDALSVLPPDIDFWTDFCMDVKNVSKYGHMIFDESVDYDNIDNAEILKVFGYWMDEFGEGEKGKRMIHFYVDW